MGINSEWAGTGLSKAASTALGDCTVNGGPEGSHSVSGNQIRVVQALAGVWLAPRCTTNPT